LLWGSSCKYRLARDHQGKEAGCEAVGDDVDSPDQVPGTSRVATDDQHGQTPGVRNHLGQAGGPVGQLVLVEALVASPPLASLVAMPGAGLREQPRGKREVAPASDDEHAAQYPGHVRADPLVRAGPFVGCKPDRRVDQAEVQQKPHDEPGSLQRRLSHVEPVDNFPGHVDRESHDGHAVGARLEAATCHENVREVPKQDPGAEKHGRQRDHPLPHKLSAHMNFLLFS
jgi:hypothetical protein